MRNYLRPEHRFPLKKETCLTHNTRMCMTSFTRIYLGFVFVTSETLRKSVRQNTVQICMASNFTESQAHFITINSQTRIVSIFRRRTELEYKEYGQPKRHHALIYGLTKSAKKNLNMSFSLIEHGG